MLWNKKTLIIGIGILCSVFVSVLSSCASYAIADKSVTYSAGSLSSGSLIFPDCHTADCLSQYSYLKVDVDSYQLTSDTFYFTYTVKIGNSSRSLFYMAGYSSSSTLSYYFPINPCIYSSNNFRWETSSNPVAMTFTLMSDINSIPTASLSITENGTYDVTNYTEAVVDVSQVSETPYDDKLDKLITAVYVVAGTMLVIYFFYCIYRMIIKGVK